MKYYIEVTAECAEELKRRGIALRNIVVIQDAALRHPPLIKAIETVTGIGAERLFSSERTRYVVLARTLYTHYAKLDGDGIEQISADMGKNRWNTNFYLRDYFSKLEGDVEFRKADMRLGELLAADPEWNPPRPPRPVSARRRRRRGRKGRKVQQPRKTLQPDKRLPKQLELF